MNAVDLPENIRQFLREYVSSIEQLEILLRLYGIAPHSETSASLARELYLSPQSVEARLNAFTEKGLVTRAATEPAEYTLISKESIMGQRVGELARLYRERRVSVINEIFSNPIAAIQTFADAFILGKKKE